MLIINRGSFNVNCFFQQVNVIHGSSIADYHSRIVNHRSFNRGLSSTCKTSKWNTNKKQDFVMLNLLMITCDAILILLFVMKLPKTLRLPVWSLKTLYAHFDSTKIRITFFILWIVGNNPNDLLCHRPHQMLYFVLLAFVFHNVSKSRFNSKWNVPGF